MISIEKLRSMSGWTTPPKAQFERLKVIAGMLPPLPADSPNAALLASLFKKGADQVTWEQVEAAELALVAVLPLEMLQARFGSLSEEYETVTGSPPFQHGVFPNPPTTDAGWRAGVLSLMTDLAKYRASKLMFERSRSFLGFVFGGLLLGAFFAGLFYSHGVYAHEANGVEERIPHWLPLLYAGGLGAGFSVLSRLYALKWSPRLIAGGQDVQALRKGLVVNCALSLAEGMIAAGAVYLLISSGLLKGDLFPEFDQIQHTGASLFRQFVDYEPKSAVDMCKLLLWAFLAGFSERLVPDKLNGLLGELQEPKPKKKA